MNKLMASLVPNAVHVFVKELKRKKDCFLFKGNEVICAACSHVAKRFVPFGVIKREHARCVNCDSKERHRLLWKYLNEKTNLFSATEKLKVLHFAPEESFYNALSAIKTIDYMPCDLFPEKVIYGTKAKIHKMDITDIRIEDNSVDVVLCNHVFEHIPNDKKAMSEVYRVMKKGAWGIFQVPIDYNRDVTYEDFSINTNQGRELAFGQKDHVRWYGKDYISKLETVGFTVHEDKYVLKFSSEELKQFGFIADEWIYFCTK